MTDLQGYAICVGEDAGEDYYAVSKYCLTETLMRHNIIPIAIIKAPEQLMQVVYLDCLFVYAGNMLGCRDVESAPALYWKTDPGTLHTLIMIDIDSPSRNEHMFREWHHWFVINIPMAKVEEGEIISQYVGIAPPKNSGLHRYVFLAFRQNSKLELSEDQRTRINGSPYYRGKFCIQRFVRDIGLWHIPAACNFFIAKWDEHVPEYIERLREDALNRQSFYDVYRKRK